MYECDTCTREFYSARSCEQHMNDTGHWGPRYECDTCTSEFRSVHAVQQHMNALSHWAPRFPCDTCSSKFATESAADAHMQAQGHYQNYCKSCDRHFQNANNLQMVGNPPPPFPKPTPHHVRNSFSDGSKASQFQGPPGNSGSMPILPDGLYQRKRPQPPPRNGFLQQRIFTQQRDNTGTDPATRPSWRHYEQADRVAPRRNHHVRGQPFGVQRLRLGVLHLPQPIQLPTWIEHASEFSYTQGKSVPLPESSGWVPEAICVPGWTI
ncbi:hypothetical protein MHUMG1_07716 [Metarhizium humberi]|uniref:C2H2-type domain-containing protein n=1 Tax=Metarhizium humberi TaxID=2596975 RepID=A0A9P8M5Y2_9HYPO|nr:hypothetical protein MHUMG1_07716 [Metarhizium humberi]